MPPEAPTTTRAPALSPELERSAAPSATPSPSAQAKSSATTTTPSEPSPSVTSTPPANGKKIPYTGLPTENPNETLVPGKMRSDREKIPEGYTKEQADGAE